MAWVVESKSAEFKNADTLRIVWIKKDDSTAGARKKGSFLYPMPNDKYWPDIKAEIQAKIVSEEGLVE
jgi:hypothetical protein